MNINTIVTSSFNRASLKQMVTWVGAQQDRFDILFNLYANHATIEVRNSASCILYYCVENHHALITTYLPQLTKHY
jgi:hypothetical protein